MEFKKLKIARATREIHRENEVTGRGRARGMAKETRGKEQERQCHKSPRTQPISEMGGGEVMKCSVKVCTRALVVELDKYWCCILVRSLNYGGVLYVSSS